MNSWLLKQILEQIAQPVYFVDRNRKILFWNRAAQELSGFSAEEVINKRCQDGLLQHIDDKGEILCGQSCPLLSASTGKKMEVRAAMLHKDGFRVPVRVTASPIYDVNGQFLGVAETFSDMSEHEAREKLIEELQKKALLDSLTGIPNRRFLLEKLQARQSEFERFGVPYGVLFLDIDHFKNINDTHGHDAGDQVIKVVARTLSLNARLYDDIGRWGGEEFLGVIGNISPEHLAQLAERLRVLIACSEVHHQGLAIKCTVSIGVAHCRKGEAYEWLLQRSDQALYQAKAAGRNRIHITTD